MRERANQIRPEQGRETKVEEQGEKCSHGYAEKIREAKVGKSSPLKRRGLRWMRLARKSVNKLLKIDLIPSR